MKHFQRFAALALALTVAVGSLAIPSHAAQQYVSTGSFWSAVGRGLTPIGRKLLFFWNDSVCAASKDTLLEHLSRSWEVVSREPWNKSAVSGFMPRKSLDAAFQLWY